MKVKQSPDDFRVDELTDVEPGSDGDFAFYRLEKTGWATPDAMAAIRRRWKLPPDALSFGGLKDRHAVTTQYLTIVRGPHQDLRFEGNVLTYLGRVHEPYGPQQIRANRFGIVLRNLSAHHVERAEAAVREVARVGVPNYFDDQRFGSVNADRRFVALEMVHGRFEEALKLALAAPYEFDRAPAKREKAILLKHWGDWPVCKAALPRGHARSLVDFLMQRPGDFRGACARLRPDLRGLYLSVYQSDLWNRFLSRWLTNRFPPAHLTGVGLRLGVFAVPKEPPVERPEEWFEGALPLPSARLKASGQESWWPALQQVLAEKGLSLDQIRIRGIEKPYFSKGDRAVCLRPRDFQFQSVPDDRHPGRSKVQLNFELPRGCYATMVIKRLTATRPLGDRSGPDVEAGKGE